MSKRTWSSQEARELARASGCPDPDGGMRKLVRSVLQDVGVQSVPVPLQNLFEWAQVRKVKQVDTLLEGGLIRAADGGFEVILRAASSPARRRFSLAHELGHLFFYRFAPAAKAAREAAKQRAPEEEERLCNVAAEELLMPDWYLSSLRDSCPSAAHMVSTVMATCQVSAEAAFFRTARYWPSKATLILWQRRDDGWKQVHTRRVGLPAEDLSQFVVEGWGDRGLPDQAHPWSTASFIYSAATRRRFFAKVDAIAVHGRTDTVVVSFEPRRQLQKRAPSALEEARCERATRALATAPRASCDQCGGTGWIVPSGYDPARRLDPAKICACRYDRPKVSA